MPIRKEKSHGLRYDGSYGIPPPGKPKRIGLLLALQMERAEGIIAEAGTLTIGERIELLEKEMDISLEEARELVYRVAGWRD